MFCAPKAGYATYLLHVGQDGRELVAYKLDSDGKPTGFACGSVRDVIGGPLRGASPRLGLLDYRCRPLDEDSPRSLGFPHEADRWRTLVDLLNYRGSGRRK